MTSRKNSLLNKVQDVQDVIQKTYYRISVIEKKLAQETLDNVDSLESELADAKKKLKTLEEQLLKLQKDNTKTFMIAACIFFLTFLIYGLYSMFINNK